MQRVRLVAVVRLALGVMGSHGGFLSRGGAGRPENLSGQGNALPQPPVTSPSTDSVSRTDSPSKIIKLDTVRVIAENVSRAQLCAPFQGLGNQGPGLQPVPAPAGLHGTDPLGAPRRCCDAGA